MAEAMRATRSGPEARAPRFFECGGPPGEQARVECQAHDTRVFECGGPPGEQARVECQAHAPRVF